MPLSKSMLKKKKKNKKKKKAKKKNPKKRVCFEALLRGTIKGKFIEVSCFKF